LTVVPILLTLTTEGQRNDTYIAFAVRGKRKADEKDRTLCGGLDRFENNVRFLPSDREVKMQTKEDEKRKELGAYHAPKQV